MVLADVRLYREGLARLLGSHENLVLVGAGPVDGNALERVVSARPDVVLLEAAAACETTIVQDLLRQAPDARVIAYGVQDEDQQALRCAEIGAAAFVMGEATGQELIGAILSLARGEFRCSPRVAAMLVRRVSALAQGLGEEPRQARLTPRERGIVALIDDGLSNKEIAQRLGIELSTVKNHVHHILEKLHALRRAQAAARFRHTQLLTQSPSATRSRS
ncbi:MAG TPA: response regulator transcription factor [Dongiaceae bacterium]|jgi:DNA-binding NarL/FixJ family response regulator